MFTATFCGKTYDEVGIELIEVKQARSALKALKSGRPANAVYTEAELAQSDAMYKKWFAGSNGKLKGTDVKVKATGMTAEEFLQQFYEMVKDQPSMLAANPEHFLIGPDLSCMQVIEVCGGAPLQFVVKFDDDFLKEVSTTLGYSSRMVCKAYLRDGSFAWGALHEFKTAQEGFDAILGLWFPIAIDDDHFRYHQEHLAVEFYNWCRFALERLGRKG